MINIDIIKDNPTVNWTNTILYLDVTNCSPRRYTRRMITVSWDTMWRYEIIRADFEDAFLILKTILVVVLRK
jgi:hypothetical protein